jgi:sporulation protein YlmC with PRC-barrel domain
MNLLNLSGAFVGLCVLTGAWQATATAPHVHLGSELLGMKVVSESGDSLGKIEDVVVHPGGMTSYAVLSFGGMLGMGDKLFAMPWTVFRSMDRGSVEKGRATTLVLPVDKKRLEKAPGFAKDSWPKIANADWAKDIDAFYAGSGNPNATKAVEASAHKSFITWKVSDLNGTEVKTVSGDELGDITDLAIDSNGRVSYAVLSVGGIFGMGDRLVPVPWDSFTFSLGGSEGDKRVITLASTEKMLKGAPEFHEGEEHAAAMCEPKWIASVYEYFSCPPYLTAGAPKADPAKGSSR